jgi:hypothetical protein
MLDHDTQKSIQASTVTTPGQATSIPIADRGIYVSTSKKIRLVIQVRNTTVKVLSLPRGLRLSPTPPKVDHNSMRASSQLVYTVFVEQW